MNLITTNSKLLLICLMNVDSVLIKTMFYYAIHELKKTSTALYKSCGASFSTLNTNYKRKQSLFITWYIHVTWCLFIIYITFNFLFEVIVIVSYISFLILSYLVSLILKLFLLLVTLHSDLIILELVEKQIFMSFYACDSCMDFNPFWCLCFIFYTPVFDVACLGIENVVIWPWTWPSVHPSACTVNLICLNQFSWTFPQLYDQRDDVSPFDFG